MRRAARWLWNAYIPIGGGRGLDVFPLVLVAVVVALIAVLS